MLQPSIRLPHPASSAESMLKMQSLQHLITTNSLTLSRESRMRHLPASDSHKPGKSIPESATLVFVNNPEGECGTMLPDKADQELQWQAQSVSRMGNLPAAPRETPRLHLASATSRALWGCRGPQSRPDGTESALQHM